MPAYVVPLTVLPRMWCTKRMSFDTTAAQRKPETAGEEWLLVGKEGNLVQGKTKEGNILRRNCNSKCTASHVAY